MQGIRVRVSNTYFTNQSTLFTHSSKGISSHKKRFKYTFNTLDSTLHESIVIKHVKISNTRRLKRKALYNLPKSIRGYHMGHTMDKCFTLFPQVCRTVIECHSYIQNAQLHITGATWGSAMENDLPVLF